MKIQVAVDMDEVLTCYYEKVLRTLKEETGLEPAPDEIQGKFLSQSLDPHYIEIVSSYPYRKGFFRDMKVMPDSQRVLKILSENIDVFIVTACMQHANSMPDKLAWLNEHFPYISHRKIIFCGEKQNISADYMIDDHPKNLEAFKGTPLLFSTFHNAGETRFQRFRNWLELESFFKMHIS